MTRRKTRYSNRKHDLLPVMLKISQRIPVMPLAIILVILSIVLVFRLGH